MKLLIHGDDQIASRRFLTDTLARLSDSEIIKLDGRLLDLTSLTQNLESTSLFSSSRTLVIENLLSHRSKTTLKELTLKLLESPSSASLNLILWFNKSLTTAQAKTFTGFTSKLFKSPLVTFQFLDSLVPGNLSAALKLLDSALKSSAPELVVHFLAQRLYSLLLALTSPSDSTDWAQAKVAAQAKKWPLNRLKSFHTALVALDLDHKSGLLVGDFSSALKTLLAKNLT